MSFDFFDWMILSFMQIIDENPLYHTVRHHLTSYIVLHSMEVSECSKGLYFKMEITRKWNLNKLHKDKTNQFQYSNKHLKMLLV